MIERIISKDRVCRVYVGPDILIEISGGRNSYVKYNIDGTKAINFSERINDIIYNLADREELTDEDKETIEDAFNEAGNRYIETLKALIKVGDTYCDPQGEYEIIAIDGEYITLKCIDEADPGWNIGKEYPGILISDAVFYIYGYYKDDSEIKYVPDSERI
jgi:hypothetical protein